MTAALADVTRQLAHLGPTARTLSLLTRPALIARTGRTFVWCDWSAIEARTLPWLAASRSAEGVLDIFRASDTDPDAPDIYELTAGGLLQKRPEDVTEEERQSHGKVPVLSLGFGGGVGALQAMAVNYGVYLDDALAASVVAGWRANNPWARAFWNRLWESFLAALDAPDTIHTAGRVAYVHDRSYLGGTTFCALPCGRLLTYPNVRRRKEEVKNPETGKVTERWTVSYIKGYGRAFAWYGKLAENITQGAAASLLRHTIVDLVEDPTLDWLPLVGHTHDEIVAEPEEARAAEAKRVLEHAMVKGKVWSEGLPLAAEAGGDWYYTKAKAAKRAA